MLVRWVGGWSEVSRGPSITDFGRVEGLLGLGAVGSQPEMYRVAAGQLDVYQNPREEIDTGLEPVDDTDSPYLAFLVGDTVTLPGREFGTLTERCVEIAVNEDNSTGRATLNPTFKDVVLNAQERFSQSIKKMTNGTLGGTSKVATPIDQIGGGDRVVCCPPPVAPPPCS